MTSAAPVRETENPYLSGNYAPVHEEITALDLEVTGTIPYYLDGRYLRIGPNPIDDPDPATLSLVPGYGHGTRPAPARRQGELVPQQVGALGGRRARDSARRGAGGPANGGFDFAANTNIIGHAGKTLAIVEAGARPYELTDELETIGPSDFCGTLFGGYTAHPKRDPATGELHAVSYNPIRGNIVQYTVTGVDGRVRRTIDIRLRAQTMMHDFSLTEHYVVLYDLPVALDFGSNLHSRPAKAVAAMLTRFAERHAAPDFFVRAAMRGSAREGSSPGRHALSMGAGAPGPRWRHATRGQRGRHPVVRGERVLRLPPSERLRRGRSHRARRRAAPIGVHTRATPSCPATPTLDRWTVDLTAGRVVEERINDTSQEFPRVDERLVGRPYRYGYAVGYSPGTAIGLCAGRDPQARPHHTPHPAPRVRARPRTRRVRLRPVQHGRCRRRRCGDGLRLRPVHRPQ